MPEYEEDTTLCMIRRIIPATKTWGDISLVSTNSLSSRHPYLPLQIQLQNPRPYFPTERCLWVRRSKQPIPRHARHQLVGESRCAKRRATLTCPSSSNYANLPLPQEFSRPRHPLHDLSGNSGGDLQPGGCYAGVRGMQQPQDS
jgi:hypothetical protein